MNIIAFDSHKRYTVSVAEEENGKKINTARIPHSRGAITGYLKQFRQGSPVAVETIGSWYWIVDEIEQAGFKPVLVNAHRAKMMMCNSNKTDRLDAEGINRLQRAGTVPSVWIPSGQIRDKRELARTRMVFANQRTRLKNRIHSVIDKWGFQDEFSGISDIFTRKGRTILDKVKDELPRETAFTLQQLLCSLDEVQAAITGIEKRMQQVFTDDPVINRLQSLPGVGFILAVVIAGEVGDISRFHSCEALASYSGMTPKVHSSGGKTRYGRLRNDVNHYLKWAFSEAGNSVAVNHSRKPVLYVSKKYKRLRAKKGHSVAVGAVGRHLAESVYWMLTRKQDYLERGDSAKQDLNVNVS